MSSMPTNLGSHRPDRQGLREDAPTPVPLFADHVRDSIAEHCPAGERFSPRAHDLQARFVVALHEALAGRIATVAGHRAPQYLRDALRGERHLTDCDLARFCLEAPRAAAQGLAVLADACGYTLTPKRPLPQSIARAAASVSRRAGHVVALAVEAEEDGIVTGEEAAGIAAEAAEVRKDMAALEQAAREVVARG